MSHSVLYIITLFDSCTEMNWVFKRMKVLTFNEAGISNTIIL